MEKKEEILYHRLLEKHIGGLGLWKEGSIGSKTRRGRAGSSTLLVRVGSRRKRRHSPQTE